MRRYTVAVIYVVPLSSQHLSDCRCFLSAGDLSAHEKAASSLGSGGATGSRPKSIPLRLYLRQAGEAESPVGKWDEVAFTTRCADAIDAENGKTLRSSVASPWTERRGTIRTLSHLRSCLLMVSEEVDLEGDFSDILWQGG
jgi:hypothetical protein